LRELCERYGIDKKQLKKAKLWHRIWLLWLS
jgi:hypothetical protein